jgi:hypothetical protein
MPRGRRQLLEHTRIHRRVVGDNLNRGDPGCADGPLEESPSRPGLTPWGDEYLKDLAELVNSTVDVAPLASDFHVGLVGMPSSPDGVAVGPSGLGQQRREPLDPTVDCDVVDLHAVLGQQVLDVG